MLEFICGRCGQPGKQSERNLHLCDPCVKAEDSRVSHYRQHNYNWMDVAKEAELNLWERQPGETDHEYNVWLHYRDAYPGKKPSYRQAAEELMTTVNAVSKIGSRWSFPSRLQAWAKYCDELILVQRRSEILAMNQQHVSMAETLNRKLARAIDKIDPEVLSPREINALMKTATELERKGRLDQVVETGPRLDDANPDLKKDLVPASDMEQILTILGNANVLKNIGVRQTVTTEVVVKGDKDV